MFTISPAGLPPSRSAFTTPAAAFMLGAYGSVTAIALPQARAAVSSHSTKSNSPSVSRTAEHTALSSLQPSADIM